MIEKNHEKTEEIAKNEPRILYLEGDATRDEILLEAGIVRARALISALPDDTSNVFTVLSSRTINHKIKIISRALDSHSVKKLRLAGADYVIMPEQIGGFYMATLVSKPGAVEFFSYITNETDSDIGFEEIHFSQMPEACRGMSIKDLNIRKETGANIIGYKTASGQYKVNPSPDIILKPGDSFIIVGNHDQVDQLRDYFKRVANTDIH